MLVDSGSTRDYERPKEGHSNLRLRNQIPTANEFDMETPQSQEVENGDPRLKIRPRTKCCLSNRRRMSQTIRFLSPCLRLMNRNRRISCLLSAIIGCILYLHFKQVYMRYMGKHAIHGGRIGQRIDGFFTRYYAQSVYERRRTEFQDTGVDFPDLLNVGLAGILELRTNDALREAILRGESSAKQLKGLEDTAKRYESTCLSSKRQDFETIPTGIPRHIFIPSHHAMVYPVPGYMVPVPFREANMRSFIKVNYKLLLGTYDALDGSIERTNLWALIMLFHFGGNFIGNHSNSILESSTRILQALFESRPQPNSECNNPTAIVTFARHDPANPNGSELALIATTPRHPFLECILDRLVSYQEKNPLKITPELFFDRSLLSDDVGGDTWNEMAIKTVDAPVCSLSLQKQGTSGIKELIDRVNIQDGTAQIFTTAWKSSPPATAAARSPRQAYITEDTSSNISNRHRKEPLRSNSNNIEPGWLCARCLRAPVMGTLEKCTWLCPKEYAEHICSKEDVGLTRTVKIHMTAPFQLRFPIQPRIPRIVHQSWFEEISAQEYPHLSRLQNSWVNSGWEYRFYDDQAARVYIDQNFPLHFREAYDALIPGAFKADLFRYLVLLKDGGVWADIDVLLEANLDSFVAPNLSFFAPRDVICTYADEAFCLWNGLMGSAPGHPAIVRAAETTVNLINQRADFYDIESDLCKKNGIGLESWKYRSEPSLALSGPCALGIAVNEALNRSSLEAFPFGLLKSPDYDDNYGDVLILVGDKDDLGVFRFSDPERAVIVASTDMHGLDKTSRGKKYPLRSESLPRRKARLASHYSETQKQRVWGEKYVYHDDLVLNERIRLKVEVDENN